METDCGDIAGGETLLRPAALAAAVETWGNQITGAGGAQLPLKLQPLLLLSCFLLRFFLRCHSHLLTSG